MLPARRLLLCLVLAAPALAFAQSSPQSDQDLAASLQKKTLVLRQPCSNDHLKFDAAGTLLKDCGPLTPFSLSAIYVDKARLSGGGLKLEAHRSLITRIAAGDEISPATVTGLPLEELAVEIARDREHLDALDATLHKIFAFSIAEALAAQSPNERVRSVESLASLIPVNKPVSLAQIDEQLRIARAARGPGDHSTISIPMPATPSATTQNTVTNSPTPPASASAATAASAITPDAAPARALPFVYKVGPGIVAPKLIYAVEAEPTPYARDHNIGGLCQIATVIDVNGFPSGMRIGFGLDPGLEANALAAAAQYRFKPATMNGSPVAVASSIVINFRIH